MDSQLFEAERFALSLRSFGEGQAVILIHGFCEDHSIWWPAADRLQKKGYRTHLLDLPGFGLSPLYRDDVSLQDMAAGIAAMIAELGIVSPLILGHSMGAYVGLALAELGTVQLGGLGLVHSHPHADSPTQRELRIKSVAFLQQHGTDPYLRQLYPSLFTDAYLQQYPDLLQYLLQMGRRAPVSGIQNALRAMAARPDRSEVLRHATYPILFLLGEQDNLIPRHKALDFVHLPKEAMIELRADMGHMGMFEAKEEWTQILENFADHCREAARA